MPDNIPNIQTATNSNGRDLSFDRMTLLKSHRARVRRLLAMSFIVAMMACSDSFAKDDSVQEVKNTMISFAKAFQAGDMDKALKLVSTDFSYGFFTRDILIQLQKKISAATSDTGGASGNIDVSPFLAKIANGKFDDIKVNSTQAIINVPSMGQAFLKKKKNQWLVARVDDKTRNDNFKVTSVSTSLVDVPVSKKEIREFLELPILPDQQKQEASRFLEKYIAALNSFNATTFMECFSKNCKLKEVGLPTELNHYEFLSSMIPYLMDSNKAAKSAYSAENVDFRKMGGAIFVSYIDVTKVSMIDKVYRTPIIAKLIQEGDVLRFATFPLGIKTSGSPTAQTQPHADSSSPIKEHKNGDLSIFYKGKKPAGIEDLSAFMSGAVKKVKSLLKFSPVVVNVALYRDAPFSVRGSGGILLPLSADSQTRVVNSWVYAHEVAELTLTFNSGLQSLPDNRWVGDGIAEWTAYHSTKRMASESCQERLESLSKALSSNIQAKDVLTWGHDPGSNKLKYYAASFAYFCYLENRYGADIVPRFLKAISEANGDQKLMETLARVTGNSDIKDELSAFTQKKILKLIKERKTTSKP